jgi:ABC-type antimicrobial peptide transport system ATPase subunit
MWITLSSLPFLIMRPPERPHLVSEVQAPMSSSCVVNRRYSGSHGALRYMDGEKDGIEIRFVFQDAYVLLVPSLHISFLLSDNV